jgi:hypothetical protein
VIQIMVALIHLWSATIIMHVLRIIVMMIKDVFMN